MIYIKARDSCMVEIPNSYFKTGLVMSGGNSLHAYLTISDWLIILHRKKALPIAKNYILKLIDFGL